MDAGDEPMAAGDNVIMSGNTEEPNPAEDGALTNDALNASNCRYPSDIRLSLLIYISYFKSLWS